MLLLLLRRPSTTLGAFHVSTLTDSVRRRPVAARKRAHSMTKIIIKKKKICKTFDRTKKNLKIRLDKIKNYCQNDEKKK